MPMVSARTLQTLRQCSSKAAAGFPTCTTRSSHVSRRWFQSKSAKSAQARSLGLPRTEFTPDRFNSGHTSAIRLQPTSPNSSPPMFVPQHHQVVELTATLVADALKARTFTMGACRFSLGSHNVLALEPTDGHLLKTLLTDKMGKVEYMNDSLCQDSLGKPTPAGLCFTASEVLPKRRRFNAVVANWTAMLVPAADRELYIHHLVAGLAEGGVLVFSEKTTDETQEMHDRAFHTFPAEWYERVLRDCGLEAEVVRSKHSFVTWVCFKQ